jgi:hypothetical protein
VSKCLDNGVRKVGRKPVLSHLFNSGVSSIHNTTTPSPWRTTITMTNKAWHVVPLRCKAETVLSRVEWVTTRSTSGRLSHTTRLSRLPHTPPEKRLMYTMRRVVHVPVPLLTLTSLVPLPTKAELLQVTLFVIVVTVEPHRLSHGLRRLSWWKLGFGLRLWSRTPVGSWWKGIKRVVKVV